MLIITDSTKNLKILSLILVFEQYQKTERLNWTTKTKFVIIVYSNLLRILTKCFSVIINKTIWINCAELSREALAFNTNIEYIYSIYIYIYIYIYIQLIRVKYFSQAKNSFAVFEGLTIEKNSNSSKNIYVSVTQFVSKEIINLDSFKSL